MGKNVLVVIDMQNDFIDGALGTKEAQAIVGNAEEYIKQSISDGAEVVYTRDTHFDNYMDTQEGHNLPVPHCIEGTKGWELAPAIKSLCKSEPINKPTFGSRKLGEYIASRNDAESITLIGLCTDICVISNALLLKAYMPEVHICVDASYCAGVTVQSHQNALEAMKMCQIEILNA